MLLVLPLLHLHLHHPQDHHLLHLLLGLPLHHPHQVLHLLHLLVAVVLLLLVSGGLSHLPVKIFISATPILVVVLLIVALVFLTSVTLPQEIGNCIVRLEKQESVQLFVLDYVLLLGQLLMWERLLLV